MEFTANIDRFRVPSTAGWVYEFPNGYNPSVINDPSRPFHFEIHCPGAGWQGDIAVGLTTEQVHANLRNIAVLPAEKIAAEMDAAGLLKEDDRG